MKSQTKRYCEPKTHGSIGFLSMFSLFGFLITTGSLNILKLDKHQSRYFNIRIKELAKTHGFLDNYSNIWQGYQFFLNGKASFQCTNLAM
jgi:hypothetical protein